MSYAALRWYRIPKLDINGWFLCHGSPTVKEPLITKWFCWPFQINLLFSSWMTSFKPDADEVGFGLVLFIRILFGLVGHGDWVSQIQRRIMTKLNEWYEQCQMKCKGKEGKNVKHLCTFLNSYCISNINLEKEWKFLLKVRLLSKIN